MFLKNFRILISYLKSYKSHLIIVVASLISVSVTLLLIGKIFKDLVDDGLTTNNIAAINHSIFFICFLIIVFGISSFFRSYYINLIAEKIVTTIKVKIYAHLINCEVEQFESMKIGDLISRFSYDTEQIAKLITNFLSFFLRNLIMLIGSIILMSYESPKLSMIVIVSVPILLIPLLKLSKYVRSLSRTTTDFQGVIASNIDESFSNIRVLHAYNKQQNRVDEFINYTQQYLSLSSTRLRSRSLFFALAISAILLSISLVLWVGSRDMVNGHISSGQIISFIYFALVAAVSCGGIAELLSEIQLPLASADRVFHLLDIPIARDKINHIENTKLESISNIEFDQVDFIYPSRSVYALKNVSFKLDAKFTGIIGASGSGKSTILQLLLKFYKVNSGSIKINNIDINHINAEHLRSLISYIPQDPCIFSGTIFSNITLSKPNASLKEVEEIAEVTGITKFINKLVNGLHTEVGEKGVKLSGGQKQRIALARALLHNAEVLLLDEATSSLDEQDESELLNDISHFIKDKKIIWIAHRLSSLQNSEEILVINDSQVIFQGSYDALTKQKDLYQTLRLSE